MNTRKKTPKAISEQLNRITSYLIQKGRQQNEKEYNHALDICRNITQTAVRYICNIYTQAGCTPIQETPLKLREVWNNYQVSREEYTNGNCLHEKSK